MKRWRRRKRRDGEEVEDEEETKGGRKGGFAILIASSDDVSGDSGQTLKDEVIGQPCPRGGGRGRGGNSATPCRGKKTKKKNAIIKCVYANAAALLE